MFEETFSIRYAGCVKSLNITGFLGNATTAVGVAWEIGEFGIDRFFGTHEQMDM